MHLISIISFKAQPKNYKKVDNYLSRSAQPEQEDFEWLKKQGVTDIFNFRTMIEPGVQFSERDVVENLGMKYHNIPTRCNYLNESDVFKFINEIEEVKSNNGKAHLHCMAGADRTGLYSYIYKMINNIGTNKENKEEWIQLGHHRDLFPNMMNWAENFLKLRKILQLDK